jgi:hypothetical protein
MTFKARVIPAGNATGEVPLSRSRGSRFRCCSLVWHCVSCNETAPRGRSRPGEVDQAALDRRRQRSQRSIAKRVIAITDGSRRSQRYRGHYVRFANRRFGWRARSSNLALRGGCRCWGTPTPAVALARRRNSFRPFDGLVEIAALEDVASRGSTSASCSARPASFVQNSL